jgi:hypothetical protein
MCSGFMIWMFLAILEAATSQMRIILDWKSILRRINAIDNHSHLHL